MAAERGTARGAVLELYLRRRGKKAWRGFTRICPVGPYIPQLTQSPSLPNMDSRFLAVLTSIGANKKVYKPTVSEIKDVYYKMFCGKKGHTEKDKSAETSTSASHGGLSDGEADPYTGSVGGTGSPYARRSVADLRLPHARELAHARSCVRPRAALAVGGGGAAPPRRRSHGRGGGGIGWVDTRHERRVLRLSAAEEGCPVPSPGT